MHLSFMSWVCPEWSLEEIVDFVRRSEYEGVELRVQAAETHMDPEDAGEGHAHGVSADMSAAERRAVRELCEANDVSLPCLATGDELGHLDDDVLAGEVASAKDNIELAGDIGAPYVRLFTSPGDDGPDEVTDEVADSQAAVFDDLGAFASEHGVTPLLALHDIMADYRDARRVADRVETDNFGLLWNDVEMSDAAFDAVGEHVRHVHLNPHEWADEYVPAERGTPEMMEKLAGIGYDGYFSLEIIRGENVPEEELREIGRGLRTAVEEA